jgi:hypothetical protein
MTTLTKSEQRQIATEGLIMLRVRAGFAVITRQDLSKDWNCIINKMASVLYPEEY